MRVRRESRSEVVVAGELVVVEVDLEGTVRARGEVIGRVALTGVKVPRTSRWAAEGPGGRTSGYTAVDAAVALAYAVLRP